MTTNANKHYDLIVVGGGPAGMIAAGRAAERGKSVLLLEKNPTLGKKLLISGGGRCNVTNNMADVQTLIDCYKNRPKVLLSVFKQFDVPQTLDFFNSRGMGTVEESEGRVFPATHRSSSVLEVLVKYMEDGGVGVRTGVSVKGISKYSSNGCIVVDTADEVFTADACIIATGGLSAPFTGSTGDGYRWLEGLGHEIVDNTLALVPVALREDWPKKLSGLVLEDIGISIWQDGKKKSGKIGKFLFTHFGASGPTILNMSSTIGELLENGDVTLRLDLHPDLDFTTLREKFNSHLLVESNKQIEIALKEFVTPALIPYLLDLVDVEGETPSHSVSKEGRRKLLHIMKGIALDVDGLLGADKAVISGGGIKKKDVNFQTMESRIVPGIYIVGDLLNIDKPSGGYSLQLCWSTGYVAGSSC